MSSLTFIASTSFLPTSLSSSISTCTFAARSSLLSPARARKAVLKMQSENYEIKQSEYQDPETGDGDDMGDGFMGKSDMDDMLGISMPDDLPSFEIREIQEARNRDELVSKLKEIANRRKGIRYDRRRGLGIDNANDYLKNL